MLKRQAGQVQLSILLAGVNRREGLTHCNLEGRTESLTSICKKLHRHLCLVDVQWDKDFIPSDMSLSLTQWWRSKHNARVEFPTGKVGVLMNHLRCRAMNVQTFLKMF